MSFEVKTTPHFEREAKILAKRYKSFKADMKDFIESLEKNPMQGDELSPGIRKIRLAIVSKGKGKSGGARVITYTICASESEGRVYLVDVYDKSDFSTVSVSILKKSYLNRVSFDQSALVKRTVFFLFSVCKGNSTLRTLDRSPCSVVEMAGKKKKSVWLCSVLALCVFPCGMCIYSKKCPCRTFLPFSLCSKGF